MKRLRRMPLLFVGLPASLSAPLLAQNAPVPPALSQNAEDDTPISRYNAAAALLRKGRSFERAISLLQQAVRAEPKSRSYHLALGCALASRAAALGEAASHFEAFAADQEKYKKWLIEWEAGHKDPNSPVYHKPRPKPPVLHTKDDGLPFTLTQEAAAKAFASLLEQAQKEWDTARLLSKTPREKADALYTQGWAKRLLRRYASHLVKDAALPQESQIIEDFTEAAQAAPKNALYWQSLGDALRGEEWTGRLTAKTEPALGAYQKSLKLQDANALLWYRLYEIAQEKQPALAEDYLRRCTRTETENAYSLYQLANLLLAKTPYKTFDLNSRVKSRKEGGETQEARIERVMHLPETEESKMAAAEAISSIEKGNRMPFCLPVCYVSPLPPLLSAAWNFQKNAEYLSFRIGFWMALAWQIEGYGQTRLRKQEGQEALRAASDLVKMGLNCIGNRMNGLLPLDADDCMDIAVGCRIIVPAGYDLLTEVCKARHDTAGSDRAAQEYAEFTKQYRAFRKAQDEAVSSSFGSY